MTLFAQETQSPSSTPLEFGSHKPLVVVIDPDESTRSILEVVMAREGFDVWSAGSASLGLSLLQGRVPDLIVLESDLGGEEGFSFVAQLRGDERLASVPVLLLAKATEQNVGAMAEVVGASNVVQKPVFARDVAALVRLELLARAEKPCRFDVKTLMPQYLLRALLTCPRTGRLRLATARSEILFEAGKIVGVNFGAHSPSVDTVVRSLALSGEQYEVILEPVTPSGSFEVTAQDFHREVMPRLQKWHRAKERSLPLQSRLMVDFRQLAPRLEGLPDEINDVLKLFDGFRTVEDVLSESVLTETVTLEVATRLYFQRVLTLAPTHGDNLVVLRSMPQLFEPTLERQPDDLMDQLFGPALGPEKGSTHPEDWYLTETGRTPAHAEDVSGGWVSEPVPSSLTHGLAPELAQQLEAFQTSMQVESRGPLSQAQRYADSATEHDVDTALEMALRQVSQAVGRSDDTPRLPAVEIKDRPSQVFASRSTEAVVTPAPVAHQRRVTTELEAAFFAPEAPVVESVPELRKPRRVWPFALGAGLVVVAALSIEVMRADSSAAASTQLAPLQIPSPTPVAPTPVPEEKVEETEPPTSAVDVRENLVEAKKLYELGQYSRARSVLEQVLDDAPSTADAWLLLAQVKYDARDIVGAKEAILKVLELEPENARAQIVKATMHFDANEREQGIEALQQYLRLAPNGEHVSEAKALLHRYQRR